MSDEIIIYKKKRGSHGGHEHHGGSWKIAFADFMTAMMALFLLLWLVSITTQEQREGIAMFFNPLAFEETKSASDGMLSGTEIDNDGADQSRFRSGDSEDLTAVAPPYETLPPMGEEQSIERPAGKGGSGDGRPETDGTAEMAAAEEEAKRALEDAEFAETSEAIRERMTEAELGMLAENIVMEITEDGLRIQITDMEKSAMFPVGSTEMTPYARAILEIIGQTVRDLPNRIAITGHTDGLPYRSSAGFDNWDLSSGRANSARRILVGAGVDVGRLSRVEGLADREHLVEEDPNDPRNRRISVLLLRGT